MNERQTYLLTSSSFPFDLRPIRRRARADGWDNGRGVVRIITRLNIGGPARHALLLTGALQREFPTVLVTGTAPQQEGELVDQSVPLTRVPLVRSPSPSRDTAAYRAIKSVLADQRPAIVHTHMAKAGVLGRIAARRAGNRPKIIHTYHGHILEGYFPIVVSRAIIAAERQLAEHTDVLVAVSGETRDDLLRLGIGYPNQYRVIPLGIRLDAHLRINGPTGRLRERLGLVSEVPLVGVVGRLAPIKDLGTLFRGVAKLPDCHLAVLGDGPSRSSLESLAANLGLAKRIHFLGWWNDVPAAMADLDVVGLSSRNEGTPVALIEAAACARPVVATDVGGVSSVVEDGVTGYLVPAGDPEALAERIGSLLGDPDSRRRMGQAARSRVAPRFSAERLVADIAALYRELAG